MRARLLALPILALLAAAPAAGEPVLVESASYPTRCAEEDNVFVTFRGPRLPAFQVDATHPAYIGEVRVDSFEPDFTDCHFGPTPPQTGPFFEPRQFVMWENETYRMVGNTDRHFWRARDVPVRIQDRTERNIHLIQFYRKRPDGRRDQVLVLYPPDGHWRLKPLPMPHLDYNVYGASFLLGPLEAEDRRKPHVDYTEVIFDPETLTFRLGFARGGSGSVRVVEVSRERTRIEVRLDEAVPMDRPFAALRSMFVTEDNADIAEIRWRRDGVETTARIDQFARAPATEAAFIRRIVSRHNRSAPDTGFIFAPSR